MGQLIITAKIRSRYFMSAHLLLYKVLSSQIGEERTRPYLFRGYSGHSSRIMTMKGATMSHVAISAKIQDKYFMVSHLLSYTLQ